MTPQTDCPTPGNKVTMTYIEFLDNSPMTKFLWLLLGGVVLAELLDGMDLQMTAYALPGVIKEFHLTPAQAGAVASVGNIGLTLGAIIFSVVADRIGRKPIFNWVLLTFAFGSMLSALASSYHGLLLARFVAGLGIGAEPPVGAAILAEYAPRRYRHIFITLVPLAYAVGWIVAALLSIWSIPAYGWRAIYWIGVIPAALIVAARYFLPESVRWLLTKGKTEQAAQITKDLARRAGRTDLELVPPVTPTDQVKLSFAQQASLLRKFLLPIAVLSLVYFCFFIQTWGISAWLPTIFMRQGFTLTRSFNYTLIIYSVTPLSQLLGGYLEERMNRKWALLLMTSVGTVLFVCFGLSFQYKWPVAVLVGTQLLNTLTVQGVITICYTLASELFPTPVRTFGIALVLSIGRLGAVLGPYALGLFLTFGTQISDIIYFFAAPLLIAAILAAITLRHDPRQRTVEQVSAEALRARTRAAVAS